MCFRQWASSLYTFQTHTHTHTHTCFPAAATEWGWQQRRWRFHFPRYLTFPALCYVSHLMLRFPHYVMFPALCYVLRTHTHTHPSEVGPVCDAALFIARDERCTCRAPRARDDGVPMLVQHFLHAVLVHVPHEQRAITRSRHHIVAVRAANEMKYEINEMK